MSREGEAEVLVADDNPDKLTMVSLLLTKAGYRVLAASDGVEAFEAARRRRAASNASTPSAAVNTL